MIYNKEKNRWLRDWEIKGTRRPFPPLYEAVKAYGERIYYDCPNYVEPKHCKWCGKLLTGRRTSFCCDECSRWFANCTVWNRGRDPYSLRILYRDNFTCQHCGEFHAMKNEHGIYIPIDDGNLNVHHIKPVSEGGCDEPENLITLCKECHKEIHKELNLKKKNNFVEIENVNKLEIGKKELLLNILNKEIYDFCHDCPAWSGSDCTINPYTDRCLKDKLCEN